MRIIAKILFVCIMIFQFSLSSFASDIKGWYCKRTTDHSQPHLDGYLSESEKYSDLIWIDKCNSSFDSNEKMIYLTVDGKINIELYYDDIVRITRSDMRTRLVRVKNSSFYTNLRAKLCTPDYL